MLSIFKDRSLGFYVTCCAAILSIVTASVYAGCYHNQPRFMDWTAFVVMLVGAIAGLVLALPKMKLVNELAAAVIGVTVLVGLCLFIQALYNYVAVVMVGIDIDHFDPAFIASAALLVVSLIASVVAVFMPKAKEND